MGINLVLFDQQEYLKHRHSSGLKGISISPVSSFQNDTPLLYTEDSEALSELKKTYQFRKMRGQI